jgi:hypothetical protein
MTKGIGMIGLDFWGFGVPEPIYLQKKLNRGI